MKRSIPFFIILALLVSGCTESKLKAGSDKERILFLSGFKTAVDTSRSYYNSECVIPKIYNASWEIRDIFSKSILKVDISRYKGRMCSIYMYPVYKLPFNFKDEANVQTRAVIICCGNDIICSYIEYISELRAYPPRALNGKSIVELSGIDWDTWKQRMDSDDDKRLVILQYYDALKAGNYESAYSYLYNKKDIKKEEFIKTAKQNRLPYMDFLDIEQYNKPSEDECSFIVKATVENGKPGNKVYQIIFDLKINPSEKGFGGWRILSTKIK